MTGDKRVLWDAFTINVHVGEEYLDDSIDGLLETEAAEEIVENIRAALIANLTARLSELIGPNIAVTVVER